MLSTIGRNPTIVPVRGNISNAGSDPCPVPKLKTSLSAAIDRAQASAARSIAPACVARTSARRSIEQFEIAVRDAHDLLHKSVGRGATSASSAISNNSRSRAASSEASIFA